MRTFQGGKKFGGFRHTRLARKYKRLGVLFLVFLTDNKLIRQVNEKHEKLLLD